MQAGGQAKAVTVENVAGAGGTVGLAQFADKNKGDGNALLVNGLVLVGAVLTNKSPVSLVDTTPIARLTGEYEVIVVPANSPFNTLADLTAALKADVGKVAIGGGSAGGTDHILAGLVAQAAGADATKLNYVPFSGGGEALAAILGGHVSAGISGYGEWEGQIKSGELRALGISAGAKVEGIDIPTLKEQGVDVELANWRSVVAAPGITDDQKKELLAAVDAMHASDAWKKVLADKKWIDLYMSGDEFGAYLKSENDRVTGVLKTIGLVQ
jgi:putative tricarboxylic transport membrane protein